MVCGSVKSFSVVIMAPCQEWRIKGQLLSQDTLFGGFAPNSETAKVMSENLGCKTVLSGSVNKGENDPSQSLQMIQRPLMTTDELKSMPKGKFILMKTGKNPMKTQLKLYKRWVLS